MSMYGDSPYNQDKNNIYDEIEDFIETHPISELIQIVADVIRRHEEETDG